MRITVALGGNALLKRGEPLSAENQRLNVRTAATAIARVAPGNELVIAHGNGPQVGLLALQAAAYADVPSYPLDVLGAETEAMIGYVVEQELGNVLPPDQPFATMLTMIEVDPHDPAFEHPTKPIGPVYDEATARQMAADRGWSIAPDGNGFRRVVASPQPKRIFEIRPIRQLLDAGTIVVCAGGGGIPTAFDDSGLLLHGIEAVIDKDLASALLAEQVGADLLVIATDVDGVYRDYGSSTARRIDQATPADLAALALPAGSMGPKVTAACRFVQRTGKRAAIGALHEIDGLVAGTAGTQLSRRGQSG